MLRSKLCLLLCACVLPAAVSAAPAYVAVPLGSLGGPLVYGTGINGGGQIAGWSDTDSAGPLHRHAFLYNRRMVDLGTLAGGTQSFGNGINDLGQVAGSSNAVRGGVAQHAVVFAGKAIVDLNGPLDAESSNAYAINTAGDVVGGFAKTGVTHAYRWNLANETGMDLGTLGGKYSQAFAVNLFGDVTGFAHVPSEDAHAFRYDSQGLVDLGTLGGTRSIGYGINAFGHVVGVAWLADGGSHAFLHDASAMIDLGLLGGKDSIALAINDADTIVGEASDVTGASRAFVIVAGEPMTDLNAVTTGLNGAILAWATAINDAGQIVAMSCNEPDSCQQAFRLDPAGAAKTAAIEYHNADFGSYFITAIPDEIAKLDGGAFTGWSRTGNSFNVYIGDHVGTSPVCRFFSTAFAPKSSHFYTALPNECANVQRNSDWQFEGRVFNIGVPDADGRCATDTRPVYRVYNNGMGGAPNHRYTTSLSVRAQMIAQGWVPEGYGADAVGMCAPL